MKNLNKNKILVGVVIILILAIGCFAFFAKKNDGYSVVYLTTGEVYVGKLCTFPRLTLTDSYILQISKDTTDPTKNNFQLNPIKEALWAPKKLYLNRDQVVFYGPLLPNSKIAQTLTAQGK